MCNFAVVFGVISQLWSFFISVDQIFGPTLFKEASGPKRSKVKLPPVIVNQTNKQQNEVFSSCFGKDSRCSKKVTNLIRPRDDSLGGINAKYP